jgi:hypothetical protein
VLKGDPLVPDALHRLQNRCKWGLQTGAKASISTSVHNTIVSISAFLENDGIHIRIHDAQSLFVHGWTVLSSLGLRQTANSGILLENGQDTLVVPMKKIDIGQENKTREGQAEP